MYAFAEITEGDCYLRVPPDPGTVAAALGACAAAALGARASAAPGAGTSPLFGTAPTESFHTFTLDSGASCSFFRDSTTLTPLSRPVAVSLANPSGGPVLAHSSTVLPCPAALSGLLSGLHLPSFSTNLVSGADLQDAWVDQFTPGGQHVTHCTCSRTGRHLATFARWPGSSLYTQTTAPPPVPASGQVAASSQVFAAASRSSPTSAPCSCCPLSHETLLWHHRLGQPSLPRLRGMASHALVSGLPRSLPPLPPGPAHTCVPCVKGRQRAAPHSSSFPLAEDPVQTPHMDVKGEVTEVLIDWIRAARRQLSESFGSDLPVLRLHSDRGGEFSSDLLRAFCRLKGIRQTFTLPASPQQNGIAERRIGMVMDVALRYASDQPSASCLLAGDHTYTAVDKEGWRCVRVTTADKLSSRAVPRVFLGFPPNAPGWQFYHPTSRCVLSSQDVTFDESVSYYRLFPYRTACLPPPATLPCTKYSPGRPPPPPGSCPLSLQQPVYGLRQAPREWHDTLRTTLAAFGFAPSIADPSLFLRTDATLPPFYVLVYVDDLVFATANTEALAHVLQRFGFTDSSPQSTPLPTGHSLSAPPSDESVELSGPYPELVGCLITSGMGLVLGGRARVVLTGHADASWADDQATQRSSQGYTFSLGSGSVSWRSICSSSVLSSSCEAEIYAGVMAAQELRWLTYVLTDLGEAPRSPPVLYVDNKAMLAFCQEHRLEHRTKHIALRYFLARELQQRGQLRLAYVASQANTADVFTKALQPCDHQPCFAFLDWSCDLLFSPTLPMGLDRFSGRSSRLPRLGLSGSRSRPWREQVVCAHLCLRLSWLPTRRLRRVFYDLVTHKFFASRDFTFDESVCYYRSRPHRAPPPSHSAPSDVSHVTPQSSPPQPLVLVVSGGEGGTAAEGVGTGAAGDGGVSSGCAGGVGVEVTPVEDMATSSRRPRPASPPSFPSVPQFPPRSPPQPVATEPEGLPVGGTGVPVGVVGGGSGSGGAGAGDTSTATPTPPAAAVAAAVSDRASGESRGGVPAAAAGAVATAVGEGRVVTTTAAGAVAATPGESRGVPAAAAGAVATAAREGRGVTAAAAGAVAAIPGESRGGVPATTASAVATAAGEGRGGATAAAAGVVATAAGESRGGDTLGAGGAAAGVGATATDIGGGGAVATERPARPGTCTPEPRRSRYRAGGPFHLVLRSRVPPPLVLPQPPESSLTVFHDPLSDYLRASHSVVSRVLSALVTHPTAPLSSVSALVTIVAGFASSHRLDYASHLVSGTARSLSTGGALAFPLEVLEDRQFELGFLAAAVPHLCTMLLAPEEDPDALDIPIPRTHAEAVKRPPGSPLVFKARYVTRGFSQREGVDFFQTFAPTPKMTTVRVLLHIAAQCDYELHSLDFSTTFLQGSLHEQMWLRCPPGFTSSFPPGTQWQLRQPVYSLRQAPCEWYATLRTTLVALDFFPSSADPSLFVRCGSTPFFVLVYVVDLVFATPD
ncbi:unnamed protein product [Closterium sp. NIES-53]